MAQENAAARQPGRGEHSIAENSSHRSVVEAGGDEQAMELGLFAGTEPAGDRVAEATDEHGQRPAAWRAGLERRRRRPGCKAVRAEVVQVRRNMCAPKGQRTVERGHGDAGERKGESCE